MQSVDTRVNEGELAMLRNDGTTHIRIVDVDAIGGGDHAEQPPSAQRRHSEHFSKKQGRIVRVSRRQDRVIDIDTHQPPPIPKLIYSEPTCLSVEVTISTAMRAAPATM